MTWQRAGHVTTFESFSRITAGLNKEIERIAAQPDQKREEHYYLDMIGKIKSSSAFVQNDRVLRYALRAFGLGDLAYAKAFVRRLIDEGIDKRDSMANKLADPNFREFVRVFNFVSFGSATTSFTRAQQGTVDRYRQASLEIEAGRTNEALRLALYFDRRGPSLTSPYELLADRALFEVTRVVLGLPAGGRGVDIDRQAEEIKRRIGMANLQDTQARRKLLGRFSALWDIEKGSTSVPVLVSGSGTGGGIAPVLLGQLQRTSSR
jgi:Protein of unknown function (DUF1217)